MIIDSLERCFLKMGVSYSVYSNYLCGDTLQDILSSMCALLNKVVDNVNEYNKIVKALKEWIEKEGLQNAVNKKLEEMLDDGTFDGIINTKLFGDLETMVKDISLVSYDDIEDDVKKINTKRKMMIPTGEFECNEVNILPSKDGAVYSGNGLGRTVLKATKDTNHTIYFPREVGGEGKNTVIKDLTIDGKTKANSMEVLANYFTLDHCEVRYHKQNNLIQTGLHALINNSRFYANQSFGSNTPPNSCISVSMNAQKIKNNHILANLQTDCIVVNNNNRFNETDHVVIDSNTFEIYKNAIRIESPTRSVRIINNYFEGENSGAGCGVFVDGGKQDSLTISNNIFKEDSHSVYLKGIDPSSNVNIENNSLYKSVEIETINYDKTKYGLDITAIPTIVFKNNVYKFGTNLNNPHPLVLNGIGLDYLEVTKTTNPGVDKSYPIIKMGTIYAKSSGTRGATLFSLKVPKFRGFKNTFNYVIKTKVRHKINPLNNVSSYDGSYIENTCITRNAGVNQFYLQSKDTLKMNPSVEPPSEELPISIEWTRDKDNDVVNLIGTGVGNFDNDWFVDIEIYAIV